MKSIINSLPLSVQIIGSVAAVLVLVGAANLTYEISQQHAAIEDNARKRGDAALDMLESVHVSAMLNRDKVADGDPAIGTLDGTMDRFSAQSRGVDLWLVMGPKIVAFQKSEGATEVEGPKDDVDEKTISDKSAQVTVTGDHMRITRPVILGQGSAADPACAACHTAKMNIQAGEIVGAYSAAVDLAPERAAVSAAIKSKLMIGVAVLAVALGAITLLLRLTAIRPLRKLAAATEHLANGDISVDVNGQDRADEIGSMARALDVFRAAFQRNRTLEAEAEENRRTMERDRLEAQARAEAEAAARLKQATSGLAGGLKRLADGDLAFELTEAFAPDFEPLRHDFNASVKQLGDALSAIRASVTVIDAGSREIATGAADLAKRTESQAASLEETTSAVEQITVNVSNSAHLTEEVLEEATVANADASKSGAIVANAEAAMQRIEDSSGKIASIISVIDEIAFQTNLLALNAGVEAARAGDAGKGFAVVAQEVRELAQRSANAAKEIKGLIQNSSNEVGNGVKLVRDAGAALNSIGGHILTINRKMEEISTASREQSIGLKEVNTAVSTMDHSTQQNAAMVEQSSAAAATLAQEAAKLRDLVGKFALVQTASHANLLRNTAARMASPTFSAPQRSRSASPRAASGNLAVKDDWEEF
ncbi:methyl-accepting chemotaxis protein [Rhizobium sp. FKL33]|uniref:methyl-accepting chemotaxis protein n=1 Tax=Rhizobium sp. FKL33 TaxID=2562307 RepID=UPI001FF008CB|nr:methyl-accepting chemotaxis protein [Rhizobium sp. FKL33]